MSSYRLTLVFIIVLTAFITTGDPAFAKRVRGSSIVGVIGKGEEGHTGGSGKGEFAGPSGVAIDQATEDVYVVDSGNSRVEEFEASGAYVSQFNGAATPAGSFSGPTAIAVDQAGDLYVADTGHNVVDKFTAKGEYLCELSGVGRGCQADPTGPSTFSAPDGVAVDPTTGPSSGDVYVSDRGHRVVDVFTGLGADVTQFQPEATPWSLAVNSVGDVFVALAEEDQVREYTADGDARVRNFVEQARTVGVDLQGGNIFIGKEPEGIYRIEELEASGKPLITFGAGLFSAPGIASPGISVSPADMVYAADTVGNVVDMFGPIALPEPSVCTANAINATSATLHGEVNPADTEAESLFQYGTGKSYGLETPLVFVGSGEHNLPVEAGITGLTPGTLYHCRLNATNKTGIFNEGSDGTFETLPLPPIVEEQPAFASEATTESVILNGTVNPDYGSTVYHFAYGHEAGNYTHVLPDISVGAGSTPISVEQATLPGSLKPGTTYHFVLIAANAVHTTEGPDETFTTASAGIPPEMAPVLSTGPAGPITSNGAILTAIVYPEGTPTMYLFEFGTDSSYGTVLFGGEARPDEQGLATVAEAIGNLQPGVTYHYRVVAFNAVGRTAGADRMFTTPNPSSGIVQPTTPQLLTVPVFPTVKVPPPKPKPKKKPKPKRKYVRKKHEAHKARTHAKAIRHR